MADMDLVPERKRLGMGGDLPSGNFGVESLPGTSKVRGHGDHMPHDGYHLGDDERAGGPMIDMGKSSMGATRHSNHGPHHHDGVMITKRRGR